MSCIMSRQHKVSADIRVVRLVYRTKQDTAWATKWSRWKGVANANEVLRAHYKFLALVLLTDPFWKETKTHLKIPMLGLYSSRHFVRVHLFNSSLFMSFANGTSSTTST